MGDRDDWGWWGKDAAAERKEYAEQQKAAEKDGGSDKDDD